MPLFRAALTPLPGGVPDHPHPGVPTGHRPGRGAVRGGVVDHDDLHFHALLAQGGPDRAGEQVRPPPGGDHHGDVRAHAGAAPGLVATSTTFLPSGGRREHPLQEPAGRHHDPVVAPHRRAADLGLPEQPVDHVVRQDAEQVEVAGAGDDQARVLGEPAQLVRRVAPVVPRLVVQVAVERLQARAEHQQRPARPEHLGGEAQLARVVLDVLEHVEVEHRVEVPGAVPPVVGERLLVDRHAVAQGAVRRQRRGQVGRRFERHQPAARVAVGQLPGDRAGAGADLEHPPAEMGVELVQHPVEEVVRRAEPLQVVGGPEVVVVEGPPGRREPALPGAVDAAAQRAEVGGEVAGVAQPQTAGQSPAPRGR